MEDGKKIDLDAPLRSLRRLSVETAAAATVSSSSSTTFSAPPARNNPAPRRFSLPFYRSEEKSGPVRNPGTVPFVWEQSPGRPKNGSRELPPVVPKPPPAKSGCSVGAHQVAATFPASNVAGASPRKAIKPDSGEVAAEAVQSDGDEEDDDVFADAPDTLSRTESFFMNCSVNGIGSFREDPEPPAEPRVQDYMIARFLPAAKALASGSPQYTFRKAATPAREPTTRASERIVSESLRSSPLILYQRKRKEEEEDDDDDDHNVDEEDEEDYRRPASRGCGLLPKLSLKFSFCLLNPFPGMKRRARPPRPRREISSPPPIENSEREVPHSWEAVYRHKQMRADRPPLEDQNRDSSSDSQTADGTSPYRRTAPPSPYGEGKRFLGVPIGETGGREMEADDKKQRETNEPQHPKAEEDRGFSPLQSPLLTPTSPSESWLLSTLPSVSSKRTKPGSFLGLHFQPRKQAVQACQVEPATKTSAARPPKPQRRQIRFAEALGRPPSAKSQI